MQTITTAASVTRGRHLKKSIRPRRYVIELFLWYAFRRETVYHELANLLVLPSVYYIV